MLDRAVKCWIACAVPLVFGVAADLRAQAFPVKPIRVVAAGSPGGSIDFLARVIGAKAPATFGQQMIIENRGGAGGVLGAENAARAAPDGYTILLIGASMAINPSLYRKLPYEVKDFTAVTQATAAGFLLAVHPGVPAKTVRQFIALAKSRKDGIAYASPGTGQAQHLGMELLARLGGFKAVHIPYKGGAASVLGVTGGEADVTLASAPAARPLLQSGRLRGLAVSSLKRIALLPDVPTIAEAAFPGFEISGWIGYFAPAATSRQTVNRLHSGIAGILRLPDVKEQLDTNGQDIVASTPEAFAAYVGAEVAKWEKVVRESGARAD